MLLISTGFGGFATQRRNALLPTEAAEDPVLMVKDLTRLGITLFRHDFD